MLPWILHYRILLAVMLPSSIFLLILPALNLAQYRQDLEADFQRRGETTIESTGAWLSHMPPAGNDLQAWLAERLQDDAMRRITLLDAKGRIVAEAGASELPRPSIQGLPTTTASAHRIALSREDGVEGMHWIASLPDSRWLVLTGSRRPQQIAIYERIVQRGIILVVALVMLVFLLRLQVRRTMRPLGSLAAAITDMPPGRLPVLPEAAREIWPEFVTRLEHNLRAWRESHEELRSNSERAEEELRETLDAIERQNIDLHAARRAAVASNQLKSEFLANISHEIRTPLTSLIGFARLLEKTPLSPRQQDHVQSLVHSSEHLLAMLNDLLDLSKIEAGRLILDETPVALPELVRDTLAMLTPLLGDKPLELHSEIAPDVPHSILGDPLRLRQIMTNLVNNAIKFTPGGRVTVRLLTERRNASTVWLTFSVEDTGIGIKPQQLEHLFDAFQQADTSTSRRFGGSGLGLTITRQLVQLLGGDIKVNSMPGQGSTFTVHWQARIDPFETLAPSAAPPTNPAGTRQLARLDPPLRVLVVDDHPANLKLLHTWLTDMGIDAKAVDNGQEAINCALQQPYDLIFMDIQMPGMNGLETAQAIRAAESRGQRVPIIALTAHALSSEREFWLRSGMDDYVSKPLQESQLLHILQQWTRFVAALPPVVDWEEATQLAGGKRDLAEDIMRALVGDLPLSRERLSDAYARQDLEAWWQEAHRLLGACRYCGVPLLRSSLEDVMSARKAAPNAWPETTAVEEVMAGIDGLLAWARDNLEISAAPCG